MLQANGPTASPAPRRVRFSALRRRWWVIALVTVAVMSVATVISQAQTGGYHSQGTVLVPSGAGSEGPGDANEAKTLAATYAGVIPKDARLRHEVARSTGRSPEEMGSRISVINVTGTAVLLLRYNGDSPREAEKGATALVAAASSGVSPAIALGSLRDITAKVEASSRDSAAPARIVGAVLGLALGFILLVAWERADPFIDDADALAAEIPAPTSHADELSAGGVAALLNRWRDGAKSPQPIVTLAPAGRRAVDAARQLAARLAEDGRAMGVRVEVRGEPSRAVAGEPNPQEAGSKAGAVMWLRPTRPLGETHVDAAVSEASDIVVLVACRGVRLREVRASLRLLVQLRGAPDWALFTRRPRHRGRPPSAGAPSHEHVVLDDMPSDVAYAEWLARPLKATVP